LENDNFLRACWRKEAEYTPVWFMRQAGRYLESYQKVRAKHDVLTISKTPELASKVAVEAARELGVDAAIIFADIMLPLEGMGVKFSLVDGIGPQIDEPVRKQEDTDRLEQFNAARDVPFVLDSIRKTKELLEDSIPLIGFSGAPFTLASYLVEGGPSRDYVETKTFMYRHPGAWSKLLEKLADMVVDYLTAQERAGVDALQLFDSWSGCLSRPDYEEFVLPHTKRVFDIMEGRGIPLIHFGTGTAGIIRSIGKAGGTVFSVDWRIPIDEAWSILGNVAVQGNLDPASVLGPERLMESRTSEILQRVNGRDGHIFSLGHGVLPRTSAEQLKSLVRFVHQRTSRKR